MLPNDVRQRVNNGVVVPGNGSVTMTETLIQPSTVQRLPNGVQVYTPERTYQQTYQLTPTVLPAPDQYQVYQQQGTQMIQPKMNSRVLANESAQQLDTLETKVFGKPNQSDTLEIRLWKLESQMSGQTYGGYTPEARISNLWKIYQYQYLGNILQNPQKP